MGENQTARQIRQHQLTKAQREPNSAELKKALDICLKCLEEIKPSIEYIGVLGYIDATIETANLLTTRNGTHGR